MTNPRILELLNNDPTSDAGTVANLSSTTNSILEATVSHQESASGSRIRVQVCRGSVKPDAGGLPRFKGLQKSAGNGPVGISILAERKAKKIDWIQQQSTTSPKFVVTLWRSWGVEDKPRQVELFLISTCHLTYDLNLNRSTEFTVPGCMIPQCQWKTFLMIYLGIWMPTSRVSLVLNSRFFGMFCSLFFLVIPFQQIFKVSNHTVCPWERQCWRFYWIPPSRWADELSNGWELAKRVCVPKTVHESIASGWDPQHTICCWWDIDGRYHFIFNWNRPKCFISLARHWWPRPQNLLD